MAQEEEGGGGIIGQWSTIYRQFMGSQFNVFRI
jgi:hypothetical protein